MKARTKFPARAKWIRLFYVTGPLAMVSGLASLFLLCKLLIRKAMRSHGFDRPNWQARVDFHEGVVLVSFVILLGSAIAVWFLNTRPGRRDRKG